MPKKRITQKEAVKKYMLDNFSITAKEAMSKLGVFRLASRISDLRSEGCWIYSRYKKVRTRWGSGWTNIKEYSFRELN